MNITLMTLREKLYQITDEIVEEFDKQEKQIEYLQEKLNEEQKKDKDFLKSLANLITARLDD